MIKLFLILFLLIVSTFSIITANTVAVGKITDFEVKDVPHDDGTGIMLSWKPLPKEMRIIQYRIYRGVSPDTLFYFGQVEVDPAAGVAAEKMFYYDKDFQMFLSIDSPSRLRKEKQQGDNSPLYDKIPRDTALLKRLLPHFTVLGIFDARNFLLRSAKVKGNNGDVSAGLKIAHFEQLAANPNQGMTYYYTVLAVDERGIFLPYADIKSAIPVDNPPDNTAQVSAVFVQDSSEFRLEWLPPVSSYDIALWQFWLLPKALRPALDDWQKVYMMKEGAEAPFTNQALLLAEKPNDYNNFMIVQSKDGYIINPDGSKGIELPANLDDYYIIIAVQDYSGLFAYSMPSLVKQISSDNLPIKPVFTVADKPNDKGDTNTLSFGLPICFITQASYIDSKRSRIRINYEISDNNEYKIDAISFRMYNSQGQLIKTIAERYPDKIIVLKLTESMGDVNRMKVEMAFRFRGTSAYTDYYVWQDLNYDNQTKRFLSGDIYYKGENLSRNYYQVFRKNLLQTDFSATKKISTISRNYDDIVNYESSLTKLVSGIDEKTGRLLVDANLTFALDNATGMPLSVLIFRDEQNEKISKTREEITALKEQLKTSPDKADSINSVLSYKEGLLTALLNHPVYQSASKVTNQRRWLSLFHREQQRNARSYAYQIMKTDTEGSFTFSEESEAYHPISNWFNWDFLIALIASVLFTGIVVYTSYQARRGKDLYLRPIAGLQEIDNAVGRATEMGRPILYVPGWSTIGEITTIASMMILNRVAKKAAEYDTRIMVPNNDYYVMPLAQEMVREAYYEAGRPDSYNPIDVFYISSDQFPWAAGINGTMIREKTATNFYMGFFNAEALLMTETGNATGSIQIAGTDAITQVPFFITTCDYTLIGEEFYAASAYLSKDAELVAMLKAQDYFKFLIIFFILLGTILSSFHYNWLTNSFPLE